jgi:hypothetical protein
VWKQASRFRHCGETSRPVSLACLTGSACTLVSPAGDDKASLLRAIAGAHPVLPLALSLRIGGMTPVGSGAGAVAFQAGLVCIRRFRLRARIGLPSLRFRPPPHRTGRADFRHPAHREGVIHWVYDSVLLVRALAPVYTMR